MLDLEKLKRHAVLFDEMAQRLGADLEQSLLSGRLSIPDLDEAVLRCVGCEQPKACAAWQSDVSRAQNAPAFCRNATLFAYLKQR